MLLLVNYILVYLGLKCFGYSLLYLLKFLFWLRILLIVLLEYNELGDCWKDIGFLCWCFVEFGLSYG